MQLAGGRVKCDFKCLNFLLSSYTAHALNLFQVQQSSAKLM